MPFLSLLVKEQKNIRRRIALHAMPLASESLPWMSPPSGDDLPSTGVRVSLSALAQEMVIMRRLSDVGFTTRHRRVTLLL
jgi:hypothetical protein